MRSYSLPHCSVFFFWISGETIDNKVRQVDSLILRKLCQSFGWNLNTFKRLTWEKCCHFDNHFLVHSLLFLAFRLYFSSKTTVIAAQHKSSLTANLMEMFCTHLHYKLNWAVFFRFICACVVKPLAGQTAQTWHSLACAVKTEGKTVRVWGPLKKGGRWMAVSCRMHVIWDMHTGLSGILNHNELNGLLVGKVLKKEGRKINGWVM